MVGIDEAGRGTAVGNMFVVGVKIKDKQKINDLNLNIKDSKKLSKKQREKIAKMVYPFIEVKIEKCSNLDIDLKGLKKCYQIALQNIKDYFGDKEYIFDGNTSYGINGIKNIVKADSKILEVKIASIIAKYAKDKEMEKLHKKYPMYDWINNSGYPSNKKHKEAIKKYGLTEYHRKSWKLNI